MSEKTAGHVPTRLAWILCFALIAFSVLNYGYALHRHAINAAQGDDFVDVLWFFEVLLGRNSWSEIADALFLANHEHITLLNHLFYVADYAVFRQVNFLHYIWLGQLFVLGSCVLLARWLAQSVSWWLAATMACGSYLNLFYWESSFWAITAISNQAVIFFALLSAWSFDRNPQRPWGAVGWALAATASQFNGLCLLFALVVARCLVADKGCPDRKRQIVWLLLVFICVSMLYVWRENPFDVASHLDRFILYTEPEIFDQYRRESSELLPVPQLVGQAVRIVPAALLGLFGASFWPSTMSYAAVATGAFFCFMFFAAARKSSRVLDHFTLVLLVFCFSSLMLVAMARSLFFGLDTCMTSRYRMYSFLIGLLAIGVSLRGKNHMVAMAGLCGFAVMAQALSLLPLRELEQRKQGVQDSHYFWLIDGGLGRSTMVMYPHNQDLRLFHAYERGYYSPYVAIADNNRPREIAVARPGICASSATSEVLSQQQVHAWSKKPKAIAVEIRLDIHAPPSGVGRLIFCAGQDGREVALAAPNVNAATGQYWPQIILKKDLPPAKYRVFWQAAGEQKPALLGEIVFP